MPRHRLAWTALVALSIGALTFVYRFNTLGGPLAGFDNDHFFQIVRADAMLDGELSLRDYSDAELRSLWPQLTYASSAIAMKTLGHSLRSEAILDAGMLALGAAATVWVAAAMSEALWPAAFATLLAVGLSPTLYNYPKIVLYALAVIAFRAYAQRPGVVRLIPLALIEVVGTLYRHDHGVYLGIAITALLLVVHGRSVARPLALVAAMVLLGLAPGLVFVQVHGGLLSYVRECLETSQHEIKRTAAPGFGFQIDSSRRLIERAPIPSPPAPRIAIRWADLSAEDRATAERALGLSDPQPRGNDQNWSYAVDAATSTRLAAIVRDARVADTDGIDRETFSLTTPTPLVKRGGVYGWLIAPGIFNGGNAGPWLRLVAWTVVIGSFVLLLGPLGGAVDRTDPRFATVMTTAVLAALLCVVFLRNAADYRLPDVSVPIAILGSWVVATAWRRTREQARGVRVAVAIVLAMAMTVTVLSVGVVGGVPEQITGTGAPLGVSAVTARSRELWRMLGGLPDSLDGIDDRLASTARYLRRCSRPSDRLLVGSEAPEVNYFARRRFAAGQIVFFGGFYTSDAAQREEIDRWMHQEVPFALVPSGDLFVNDFAKNYPLLAAYLQSRYRKNGQLQIERGSSLDVWVDKTVAMGVDAETQLPCELRQ